MPLSVSRHTGSGRNPCRRRSAAAWLELRHGAQHGRNEGVAVRPRPHPVVAEIVVAVVRDRRLDLGDQRLGLRAAEVDQHPRGVAEPAAVRRPAVAAHRLAPADHVVAAPGGGVGRLEDDPAVDRENALPAAGAAGKRAAALRGRRSPAAACRRSTSRRRESSPGGPCWHRAPRGPRGGTGTGRGLRRALFARGGAWRQ